MVVPRRPVGGSHGTAGAPHRPRGERRRVVLGGPGEGPPALLRNREVPRRRPRPSRRPAGAGMSPLADACTVAQTVAQCLNAPTTPSLGQYGADIPSAAAHMIGAFLDGGPAYCLALLLFVFVLPHGPRFALLPLAGPKERPHQ